MASTQQPTKPLAGKVAIVTGSSDGIGKGIALRLASDGAFVVVNGRNQSRTEEVVQEIKMAGGDAVAILADISNPEESKKLVESTLQLKGKLDIFVQNAGIAELKPLVDVTVDDFDRVFGINAKGAFFALQSAARVISDGGRIVSISSGVTKKNHQNMSVYAGSKGALEQFTKTLAFELAPKKVTVNTVSPGVTLTKLVPDSFRQYGETASPFKRIALPEDIANIVSFLVSAEGGWLTAQNIQATGGATIS